MNLIGNILWIVFGGFAIALEYFMTGILWCCTIIGIPFGLQLFKLGIFSLVPFGQQAIVMPGDTGCLSATLNIIWFLLGGICIVFTHLCLGVLLCITIVGIPFGIQHFKLMQVALTPFGRTIVSA